MGHRLSRFAFAPGGIERRSIRMAQFVWFGMFRPWGLSGIVSNTRRRTRPTRPFCLSACLCCWPSCQRPRRVTTQSSPTWPHGRPMPVGLTAPTLLGGSGRSKPCHSFYSCWMAQCPHLARFLSQRLATGRRLDPVEEPPDDETSSPPTLRQALSKAPLPSIAAG